MSCKERTEAGVEATTKRKARWENKRHGRREILGIAQDDEYMSVSTTHKI
jgi:hypothetical protein